MSLYIPFEHYTNIGGPSTFMRNLKKVLDEKKFKYCSNIKNAKGIFFPITFDKEALERFKKKKYPVIQRLDGIHYPEKHGDRHVELNKEIKDIYLNYADFVVFQSDYSKKQVFEMFGTKPEKNYTVIHNGVDKSIFYPYQAESIEKPEKIKFITTGNFRNPDMIVPIIRALDSLREKFDFKLSVLGPVTNEGIKPYLERDYIEYAGEKSLPEVAEYLRESDIFLFSSLNPPCPNAVLEAVSCGLPVVAFDDGSILELLHFNRELLAYVNDKVFKNYEELDPAKLAEKIELAVNEFKKYKQTSLDNSHLYAIEICALKYMEVFNKFSKKDNEIMFKIEQKIDKKIRKKALKSIHKLPETEKNEIINSIIKNHINISAPDDALKFLFELQQNIYRMLGEESTRYGNGIHSKHRHIKYHDFFIQNINDGDNVLDIGCGYGALAYDIAKNKPDIKIIGIDIARINIDKAQNMFAHQNIEYICADALNWRTNKKIDVVILSNVLEHIENRVEFLRELNQQYNPDRFLVRVPVFERDWTVPLKKELGLDYMLDKTHYIEYSGNEFFEELDKAGLNAEIYQINWGEIWTIVTSKGN